MQHKLQYNTGVVVQDNAAQQWWYSAVLAANTILNTGKFAKMYIQSILVKMVAGVLITLT